METLGNHLIQMACWLTGFWFIYFVFLRKETFYETNRWFLLFGLFCSLIMPFFPVTYTVTRAPLNTDLLLKATMVTTVTQPEQSFFRENLWLWIYLAGILLFTIRFISQWMKIRKIEKKGIRLQVESAEVFLIEKETAPFSFFRKIFISKSLQSELEIKTIVSHEKVHIEERHWIDLLIFEVVRALQWFNPLLLFYRKAMMQNHEYLADRGATANGMNIRTYQAILANQLLGVPVVKYASSFTMFNPTKRILMMNKNRTRPMKRLKLLLAIPLAAFILYAFAEPKYVSENKSINSENTDGKFEIDNTNSTDDISISKEGYHSVSKLSDDNGEVTFLMMGHPSGTNRSETKPITVNGKVTDQEGNSLPGAYIIVANSTTATVSDINGKFSLSGLTKDDELVITFVGYKTVKMKAGENLKIKMEREVIKVSTAQTTGEMAPPPPPPPHIDNVFIINENGEPLVDKVFHTKGNGGKPLIVVDDVIKDIDVNKIDPETIESIVVLKDKSATELYGNKAKDGVVVITTKKNTTSPPPITGPVYSPTLSIDNQSLNIEKDALIVIDGKISYAKLEQIDALSIKSINVIKGTPATDKYGDKAKDGAIEITTMEPQWGTEHYIEVTENQVVGKKDKPTIGSAGKKKNVPEQINQNKTNPASPSAEIRIRDTPPAGKEPLVVVDGSVKEYGSMNTIDPQTIEKIEVLKNESATKIYGEKGGNGVILITTKKNQSGNTYNIKVDKDQIVDKNGAPVSGFANEKKVAPEKVEVIGYANQQKNDESQKFILIEETPQFIGGGEALETFLKQATANAIEKGTVKVFFTVKQDGKIDNIHVDKNVSKTLQEQALKVMKSMPEWKPGLQGGKKVKTDMELDITF